MRVACETQRTHEWFQARLGLITASESAAPLSRFATKKDGKPRKEGETAERLNYKIQLVAERLTKKVTPQFVSIWMKAGAEFEDEARACYECRNDVLVNQTGFVLHPRFDFFGASPDFLLEDGGVGEIKIPTPANHLKYLLGMLDPREEHGAQMLGEIICCESPYVQFVSYNPDFPTHLKLFTKRYERGDMGAIDAYESEIEKFNSEVEAMVSQLSTERTSADRGLSPSPEQLAAEDMAMLEGTWQK